MKALTEKYRPSAIQHFAGLDKPKRIISRFAEEPSESAWLFVGEPGTGKTTMGLALAETIGAELFHIPSQKCTLAAIDDVARRCQYVPLRGRFHLVLIDEADKMSQAAQLALLSMLDATAFPPNTIFVFTCNSTAGLEERFLSRCRVLEFSTYGLNKPGAELLERVWDSESGNMAHPALFKPDFPRILKNCGNNVRAGLMALEMELLSC
jgi:replication-associated recombination protein RarA